MILRKTVHIVLYRQFGYKFLKIIHIRVTHTHTHT